MIVVMPICSMLTLFAFDEWRFYAGILVLTAFGMDTGAWFFGKKFGRNLLWPEVSPKKTVEGLIGGLITSVFLSSLFVLTMKGRIDVVWCAGFALVALFSHAGDLAQSKLKRQFRIKNSSSLIPGHGGVYDRIDGLIFSAPFFITGLVLWGVH
jgi:phosphatidate cytidylyltransferase